VCKFEALNYVKLTDNEFKRILEQIIKPDVFKTSKILREINTFLMLFAVFFIVKPITILCIKPLIVTRNSFEALNHVKLTDNEFKRILEQIIKPDVFKTSKTRRETHTFEREKGKPFNNKVTS
jgi:predicted SprT family Zn-dependent metalloprotease